MMIRDRPAHLLADPAYSVRPPLPYLVDWSTVPELIRHSTADLGGIQPVTRAMIDAAGGILHDLPSEAELAMFRQLGTEFQIISVVASLVAVEQRQDALLTKPFALSLMPAQKRGKLEVCSVETAATLGVAAIAREAQAVYRGYDPFSGVYGVYALGVPDIVVGPGFLDEIGLVVDAFYLATTFETEDVLAPDIGMPPGEAADRYARYRRNLLFKPFKRPEARRVWGAESPIELFMIQELSRRGLHPQLQMLIMENGSTYPSFYHLWGDIDFRYSRGPLTGVDLYFPEKRLAVFCDGGNFHRGKRRRKDESLNERLRALSITPLRLPGNLIVNDLARAADLVSETLSRTQ
jgi:hypothetical protein